MGHLYVENVEMNLAGINNLLYLYQGVVEVLNRLLHKNYSCVICMQQVLCRCTGEKFARTINVNARNSKMMGRKFDEKRSTETVNKINNKYK
jgi:hypothetical protein